MKNRFAWMAGIFLGLVVATASATSLAPLYSNTAGSVKQVSVANLQQSWVVTAVENSSGNLEVIVWNDTGTALSSTGSATGGAVNRVAITGLDSSRVVTADVNATTGYMELSVWKVTFPAGTIAQQGSTISLCCTTTAIAISRLDSSHVATAASFIGTLYVNAFKISSTGVFTTEGVASAGAVSQTSITTLTSKQVATAVRNGSGDLEVISWSIGGGSVTLQGDATAGTAKHVASTAIFTNQVNTAIINGKGNLELINWGVTAGGKFTRQTSKTAGAASQVALTYGELSPFTATVDNSKNLAVEAWNSSTTSISKLDSYNSTSAVNQIAVAQDWDANLVGNTAFVTAARNSSGDLEVTAWLLSF